MDHVGVIFPRSTKCRKCGPRLQNKHATALHECFISPNTGATDNGSDEPGSKNENIQNQRIKELFWKKTPRTNVWSCLVLALLKSGPAPWGAFRGCAAPNDCLCPPNKSCAPPKQGLCPEEINRLGATGVQIEAWDSQNSAYRFRIYGKSNIFLGYKPDFGEIFNWRPFFFWSYLRICEKSNDLWKHKPGFVEIFELRTLFFFVFTYFVWSTLSNSHK